MRLYAYIAGALLLAGLVWYEIGVHRRAAERDAFEEKAQAAEKRALDIAEQATQAASVNRGIGEDLSAFRGELSAQSQAFQDALTRRPISREVPRVDPKTGANIPCYQRDPALYRQLFNCATLGTCAANP